MMRGRAKRGVGPGLCLLLAVSCQAHPDAAVGRLAASELLPLQGEFIRDPDFVLGRFSYYFGGLEYRTRNGITHCLAVIVRRPAFATSGATSTLNQFPGSPHLPAAPFLVPLESSGDVADLYRRITGKEHPTLKGEMSADYKAFLEGKQRGK